MNERQPWQVPRDEWMDLQTHRVDTRPAVSLAEFAAARGINPPRDTDIADFMGGMFAERTRHGRGKLREPARRLAAWNEVIAQYEAELVAGRIPTTEVSSPLSDRGMDRAWLRSRHARHVRAAICRGESVPPEVLADYPDLANGV